MLPTKPLSMIKLFFSAIKDCKDNFFLLLTISVVFSTIGISGTFLTTADIWVNLLIRFLSGLLGCFCFCWGICFAYNTLLAQKAGLKGSLKIAVIKFPRILGFLLVFIVLPMVIVGVFASSGLSIKSDFLFISTLNPILKCFLMAIVIIPSALIFSCFAIIAQGEILIRNSSVFLAIKKALRITFRIRTIWRMLCFLLTFMVFFISIFILVSIVTGLFSWLGSMFLSMVSATTIAVASVVLILLPVVMCVYPLYFILFVYFYNDLMLRSEE